MAEGEGGLPEFVEDKKKTRFNVFGKKKSKGSARGSDKTPFLQSQPWTEMETRDDASGPQTLLPPRELEIPVKGGKKSSMRKSSSKTYMYQATPKKENPQRFETPPFNVQENVFVPGQCEDDQQSSNPLVTMVDTQLRPMTDPVTVNIDRIAELEKQMHDGEVEKKLLKEMTDEKHREKVQLLEEQLKLLEAESIEKKLQLEHTLNEHLSLSEQSNEGAGASSLSEEDKKVAQLTEQLLDKEDEVEKLTKQLQVKTSEVASLEDKKAQLEQQLTHTVDYTAALAQKEDYDKELQDIRAERKHYKIIEAQNCSLQGEIQQLKQEQLSVSVSRQGEETIADLQQQLREKDDRIHGLTKASEEKTAMVYESYGALQENTEKFERFIEKQSYQIEQQTKEYKDELEHTITAGGLAIQKLKQRCTELEQHLTRTNEENKRIEREKEKIVKSSKQLQSEYHEKEQLFQELNYELLKSRIEFKTAQDQNLDLHGELSSLQQQMTDLRDVSEGKGKIIQQLRSDQIDTDKKKLSELKEDLTVARQQNEVFQEEITRSVKEEKRAKQIIALLQSELDKNKQALSKSGKKSLDELRRSYEELKVQTEEERTITERQLSELNEDLAVARQQNEVFQEEITKSVREEKGARQVIAQLQSELDKKKQALSKSGKKSLDELRRSYEELKVQTEEERAITERQVRAYKKQVDELSEKLKEANDKTKQVRTRCDELIKVEAERNVFEAKIHECEKHMEKLNDMLHGKVIRELELEERLEAGNKIYQQQLTAEKAIMTQDMDKMRNANKVLQQRLRQSWNQLEEIRSKKSQEVLIRAESDSPSWLLDSSEVIVTDEKLGTGSYGTVQVALFRGTRVAAKCMHELILSDYNKELFVKEMNMSASLHHPNIVQFIGAPDKAEYPILLYELMETSLYSYLQKGQALPRPLVISIGCDVASALAYLHLHKPHPIIHRDVSSPNVLMESLSRGRWRCKLSDFGSARLQPHAKTKGPGNAYYSSHEAGDPANHTPAMDVYSFGVLLTEITLRRLPAPDTVSRETQANGIDWVLMKDLVLLCLMIDRLKRPKILTVIDSLGGFL